MGIVEGYAGYVVRPLGEFGVMARTPLLSLTSAGGDGSCATEWQPMRLPATNSRTLCGRWQLPQLLDTIREEFPLWLAADGTVALRRSGRWWRGSGRCADARAIAVGDRCR